MHKEFVSEIQIENIADPIKEIISNRLGRQSQNTVMFRDLTSKQLHPSDYLCSIASHIPKEVVSIQNFAEIKNLADRLTGGLTSFFGFETRLTSTSARSDYLIAISSRNGEREALKRYLSKEIPNDLKNKSEWRNLKNFSMQWSDNTSVMNRNVIGLWLEFDTAKLTNDYKIPNIFLQIRKTRIDTKEDEQKFKWITQQALPILTGSTLSKNIEKNLINAVKKLPEETSLIHVGTMLSRNVSGVRIVINRIKPEQIIPYLKSIGYDYDKNELIQTINEIGKYSSRLILHINIGEKVDPKIGIECSFAEDKYHLETEWNNFFDYLQNKGLCIQEKREALLDFPGIEQENNNHEFDCETYMVVPKIKHKTYSRALVRYLSHVKIVYHPNLGFEAKAYPGIRLFGKPF